MYAVAVIFLIATIIAAFARRWGLFAAFLVLTLLCGFFSLVVAGPLLALAGAGCL